MITDYQHFDLFGSKTFIRAKVMPPFRYTSSMENEACFYYIVNGSTNLMGANFSMEIKEQEGCLLTCGTYINDYLKGNENEPCEVIGIHFSKEVLMQIYEKELPNFLLKLKSSKDSSSSVHHYKSNTLIDSFVENLLFYFDHPDLVSEDLIKLKIKELILLLVKTDSLDALRQLLVEMFSDARVGFKQTIDAHLYNNLSLNELAVLTNLSLSSFKRTFHKYYNQSPARYIKIQKLKKASELLLSTNMRVSEVAYDCGFTDVSNFSKSFHKYFDQSPRSYRASRLTHSLN